MEMDMDTREAFSTRITSLRFEKGLTQGTLAEALAISRQSVTQYENGVRVPDIEVLAKFAKYFGVTSDYLLGLSDNRSNESAAIGDKLGLKDETIECLTIYNRCEQLSEADNEELFNYLTGWYLDDPYDEQERIRKKYTDYITFFEKRTNKDALHDSNDTGIEVLRCASKISKVINHILSDIEFLCSLCDYLYTEYHNTNEIYDVVPGVTLSVGPRLDVEKLNNNMKNFIDRTYLFCVEEKLKKMHDDIKKQEKNNAQKNKRQK